MSESSATLLLDNVSMDYPTPQGSLHVLKGLSLEVPPGGLISVVGPSGSGKSTLLNVIGSLEKPTAGTVRLGDIDVTSLDGSELARYRSRHVGFVFQDHHLLPQLTAIENVLLPTLVCRDHDARAHAKELLEQVGLADKIDSFPGQLSGGQRQRVAAARALINRPTLLLCDEPTGDLDRSIAAQVVDLFVELARRHGSTVIMVTHDLKTAGDPFRCCRLAGGRLVEHPNVNAER